ncbi:MAG TPA: CHAT domain-containing tetratricopeptide repeat protein [Vicinamibacterales bacterium]|nr:CHAT domain-containing tetratricopeptide repeat protein [Vicinamibacterales bacterium]
MAALLDQGQFNAATGAARSLVDSLQSQSGGALDLAKASDVLVQALIANGMGASPETLVIAERSLNARTSRLGERHPDSISSLQTLGEVLRAQGQPLRAIEVFTRVTELQDQSSGIDRVLRGRALDRLSTALREASRYDEAVETANRAVAVKEGAAERREQARSHEVLALALLRRGRVGDAGPVVDRVLQLRRGRDEEHPDYIGTLSLLSDNDWANGRFVEAKDNADRALALAERSLRTEHPAIAECLRRLAAAHLELWDIQTAHDLGARSLDLAQRALGASHPAIAEHLNDLANATFLLGDYTEARRLYDRYLTIREGQFGPNHDAVATAAYNLALVDASLGDYESSRGEYDRAARVWESLRGPSHPFVAQALLAQAIVIRHQGSPSDAVPLLERVLSTYQQSSTTEGGAIAETLTELAQCYLQLGKSIEAAELSGQARRIWTAAGSPDDQRHAATLALAAELEAGRGDLSASTRDYHLALAIDERVLGTTHPETAQIQLSLARTLARSARRSEAITAARKTEAVGREHLRLMLRALPERQALAYASVRPRGLDVMLSLAGANRAEITDSFDAVIRGRALVLDEISTRLRLSPAAGPAMVTLASDLAKAQQRIAGLIVQGAGAMPRQRYEQLLTAAREDRERTERRLAEANAEFRVERDRAQTGLGDVAKALPAGVVLVSFVRYQQLRLRATPHHEQGDEKSDEMETPSYMAFVLRSSGTPIAVRIGNAAEVEARVARWRSDVAAEALSASPNSGQPSLSSQNSGLALRSLVWDPVSAHLSGASTVLVVADGVLGLVPFAALPAGSGVYLLEQGPPIHYLTAERDVVLAPVQPYRAPEGLLAVGGPAFDRLGTASAAPLPASRETPRPSALRTAPSSCDGLRQHRFEPLAATLDEVRDLARIWANAGLESKSALLLTGVDATERAVKGSAGNHLVLHLATHGFFVEDMCSATTPAPSGRRGVGGLSSSVPVQNPLRLSGLALAGANLRAQASPDQDDGILTAEEVSSLDLRGVQWAVLSACDTGVGEIKAGEGVFGLRRAFQVAGARTVIMSLWSVEDQSTRAWMRALYEGRFQRHLSTADAVHQASLSVLRDRRARGLSTHPFFWAAFVAAGDWR